jgi:hypothetical protein
VLAGLGVDFGGDLLEAGDANPHGFFESLGFQGVLQQCLGGRGNRVAYSRGDVDAEGFEWLVRWLGERLRQSDAAWVGLKDPLLVLSLPVVVGVLEDLGASVRVLGVWRPVNEVAASLAHPRYGRNLGEALPLARELARLRDESLGWSAVHDPYGFRGVSYPDLVKDPAREVRGLADWLGLDVTDEAVGFPTPQLRHHGEAGRWVLVGIGRVAMRW